MTQAHLRIIEIAGAGVVLIGVVLLLWLKRPRRLKTSYFTQQWQTLQKLCNNKKTWPQAVIEADRLLDEVLKKRHLPGKSMGERLVAAQRLLSHNDDVWYAHNLYKKLMTDKDIKLKEIDVKDALMGVRQALKDLGALKTQDQDTGKGVRA